MKQTAWVKVPYYEYPGGHRQLLDDRTKNCENLVLIANKGIRALELEEIFHAIPRHITSLGYSGHEEDFGLLLIYLSKVAVASLTELHLDIPVELEILREGIVNLEKVFPDLDSLKLNLMYEYGKYEQAAALDLLGKLFEVVFAVDDHLARPARVLDLSYNSLGLVPNIEQALARMSPGISGLNLTGNFEGKSRSALYQIMKALPQTVVSIAYDARGFIRREDVLKELYFDYSFQFNCLAGLAMVGGSGLLVAGILLTQPVLAVLGGCLVLGGGLGATLSAYGFFKAGDLPPAEEEKAAAVDDDFGLVL